MKNLLGTKEHSRKRIVLAEKGAFIGEELFCYRLTVTPGERLFFATVKGEDGVGVIKTLGTDRGEAERIFNLLVENDVAPCHVSEIVDELLAP